MIGADSQGGGVGSRGNSWIGMDGNLFISFALDRACLPDDLKLESSSIYFSYLLKEILSSMGSSVWIKWPNDFYIDNRKIGGTITNLSGDIIVCGIGLNLHSSPDEFDKLDIAIDAITIANIYAKQFDNLPSWKQIFSKFKIEFERSKKYLTHIENEQISLGDTTLLDDGSLEYNNQRIFSLR